MKEEYKYLHCKGQIALTWKDYLKLAIGQKMNFSFCLRLVISKDDDDRVVDFDKDLYYTSLVVEKAGEAIPTKEARFDENGELHK